MKKILLLIVFSVTFVVVTPSQEWNEYTYYTHIKLRPATSWPGVIDAPMPTITFIADADTLVGTPSSYSAPLHFEGLFRTPIISYECYDDWGRQYVISSVYDATSMYVVSLICYYDPNI